MSIELMSDELFGDDPAEQIARYSLLTARCFWRCQELE